MTGPESLRGHDWVHTPDSDDPAGYMTYTCSRCGFCDNLEAARDPASKARALDKWAGGEYGVTCDELVVSEILGS